MYFNSLEMIVQAMKGSRVSVVFTPLRAPIGECRSQARPERRVRYGNEQ
jgi:hypothetical protein